MGQFHMAEQAENPSQAKQSALTCVISGTREQRHQLPRCMRGHGCTIEEVTRDTSWQAQNSHSRQDSTRSQRTPKVQHREDSSLLSPFALVDPQSPCPRMTFCLDCAETPAGKLRSTELQMWGRSKRSTREKTCVVTGRKEQGWGYQDRTQSSYTYWQSDLLWALVSLSIKQGLKIILTSPGY